MEQIRRATALPPRIPRRGLFYGDGVFRTALVLDGTILDRERQFNKLTQDALRIGIEAPPLAEMLSTSEALLADQSSAVLRLLLCRSDSGRGYAPDSASGQFFAECTDLPLYRHELWTQGAVMAWSDVLLGTQPRLAGIKHLNRLELVLASRNWPEDLDEALMCDAQGRVVGGTRTNLFLWIDGVWVTPELSQAGVAGLMRDKIIEITHANGIDCEIGLISPDEVRHAEECFVSNSLIGIWPVRCIGSLVFPAPGARTLEVMKMLAHPWSGE